MKTTIKALLLVAIVALSYLCIMSIMTPIQFEKERAIRERAVVQALIDLRTAQIEHRDQKGSFSSNLDSLIHFIKTGTKMMVLKEGTLSDAQLASGLTETRAMQIIRKGNQREITEAGLQNFRRDTTFQPLLEALFSGRYTQESLNNLKYIPFSDSVRFEIETNDNFLGANNRWIPLCEIRAPYSAFLKDINRQEALNLIDLQRKLDRYPGLKAGSVVEPNNFAGNWE